MCSCNSKKSTAPSKSDAGNAQIDATTKDCGGDKPPCPPCKAYQSIDSSKDIESYNCAGLAHRTYTFIGDVNVVKSMLAKGNKIDCSAKCDPCKIKHWLWEYDLQFADADGNIIGQAPRDFHTVAGPCDQCGNNPTSVYSKNGARPLEGPGTGPSFRPPAKEPATKSNRYATPILDSLGRPIYKIRTNFVETCYCLPCPS